LTGKPPILVTGVAGFIGGAVAEQLRSRGDRVIGLDNLNAYYDPALKWARLERLEGLAPPGAFRFHRLDLTDADAVTALFAAERPARVLHLAAQAGVRHSIDNPSLYIQSNVVGFGTILEACRRGAVEHLVYASSSSIYGGNRHMPFSEQDPVNHPVSLYAATKKANELMAHTYSHHYGLPATGLRFFTVYGPWGRPDMAFFKFTKAMLADEPIDDVYNGIFREMLTHMMEDTRNITAATHMMFIAKNFERIGDHATNIAETVHYAIAGDNLPDDRPKADGSPYAVVRPPRS